MPPATRLRDLVTIPLLSLFELAIRRASRECVYLRVCCSFAFIAMTVEPPCVGCHFTTSPPPSVRPLYDNIRVLALPELGP